MTNYKIGLILVGKKLTIFLSFVISVCFVSLFVVLFYTKEYNKSSVVDCALSPRYLGLAYVEIADTDQEKEQGLMFRKTMCAYVGMLFIYQKNQDLSFWMKNTYISLDMIYIDESGIITTIHKNTVPEQVWPVYNSSLPSKYVLEVKAGFSDMNSIKTGQKVDIMQLLEIGIDYGMVDLPPGR